MTLLYICKALFFIFSQHFESPDFLFSMESWPKAQIFHTAKTFTRIRPCIKLRCLLLNIDFTYQHQFIEY